VGHRQEKPQVPEVVAAPSLSLRFSVCGLLLVALSILSFWRSLADTQEEALVPDALSGQGSAQGIFIQARNGCEKMPSSPEHVGHETDDPTMEHCSAACLSEATCAAYSCCIR
ncbi:unnamed protein product, partial [Polarella glacialis]